MKTFKTTIETFASDAINHSEMNFIKGGGEPIDIMIPPKGKDTGN